MNNVLPTKQLALLGGDIIMILASFCLAPVLRFRVFLDFSLIFDWPDLSVILFYLLTFYIFDFYSLQERFTSAAYALRFLVALMVADLGIAAFLYVFNARPYPASILILNTVLIFFFCLGWRRLYYYWNHQIRRVFRALIIGAGKAGNDLQDMLSHREEFELKGFLDDDPQKAGMERGGVRVLGNTTRLMSFLNDIDIVIVAITRNLSQDLYRQLVQAKMKGIMVYEMPSFCEEFIERIPVNHVSDLWFVYVPISGVRRNLYNVKIKRITDLILSLLGLLITLPLMLIVAPVIKCESKGPVFYVQRRIGWNGRPFDLVKLRTMKVGFDSDRQYAGRKDDPRITRIGRIMRFFRIDEIPQMWNVIKGEMSFIGPRALIKAEIDEFSPQIPYFSLRHSIRPGITGWAQINYPHGITAQDALAKLEYDLYYIKNLSPLLDLLILVRTVKTVIFGRGAK